MFMGGGKNRLCRMQRSQLACEERKGQTNQEKKKKTISKLQVSGRGDFFSLLNAHLE